MRKLGLGKRLLTLLLALTMITSPVLAATGDIAWNGDATSAGVTGDYLGVTGLDGNIDANDTISWPIKVYDYLNDGMLFEYSQSQSTSVELSNGGWYGGRTHMPKMGIGNDYTIQDTYSEYAYQHFYTTSSSIYSRWRDANIESEKEKIAPQEDVDPMHLELTYPEWTNHEESDGSFTEHTKPYVWVSNFARDNYKYYPKEDVQYVVLVYRTNDLYNTPREFTSTVSGNDGTYSGKGHTFRFYYSVATADYSTSAVDITKSGSFTGYTGADVTLDPSSEWTYVVYDMSDQGSTSGTNWADITGDRIAGVRMCIPICLKGEEIDISHIAYFSSQEEAENFGSAAVRFDKDPGEYLQSVTTTTEVGVTIPDHTADALDFADGAGFSDSTYTAWGSNASRVENGDRDYAKLSTSVSSTSSYSSSWNGGANSAYVCSGIYSERTSVRYVTRCTALTVFRPMAR